MALTNTQRIKQLEVGLAALTARVTTLETPAPPTPDPTPTPPPTPDPTPTPPPAATRPGPDGPGFPVGVPAGTVLTPSGPLVVTVPNTVIEGRDIAGSVVIQAPGVVIRRSRIHGSGYYGVQVLSGDVTITDCDISGFENGIAFNNWTATRVDIHGVTGDGVKLGSNVTLQDSWIHGLTPGAGAHADGGQMQNGVRNLVVRRNSIDAQGGNAALFICPDLGPSTEGPVAITGNYLDGGGYTLFCVDGNNGQYFVGNIAITGNTFGAHHGFGTHRINVPVTWTGNTVAATGAPVTQ